MKAAPKRHLLKSSISVGHSDGKPTPLSPSKLHLFKQVPFASDLRIAFGPLPLFA
jgi:hypothetical protein